VVLTLARVGGNYGADTPFTYLTLPDDATTNQAASQLAGDEDGPGLGVAGAEPEIGSADNADATATTHHTHTVSEGETLGGIAEQYGVSVDSLLWNNPELTTNPDLLIIGANLRVPALEGVVYDVRLGDTVTDIALTYGIDPQTVIDYEANNLDAPDLITEGMVLLLPGGAPPPPPEPEPEPAPAPEPEPDQGDPPAAGGPLPAGVVVPLPAAPAAPVPSVGYIWPVAGPVWSGFGPRWGSFHKGIDIGAGYGTAIAAAASGQVVWSAYADNGYGNYIVIRHDDGTESLYAHLSALWVGVGTYVNQGAGIGAVGCTGWCTGNHLHFEIHIGGSPVNPLNYLP
jgi:murein DD-endopeptidase MepM/ murein hydrolase activator NlpD